MKSMTAKLKNFKKELEAIDEELRALPAGYLVKRGKFYWQAIKDREIGITRDAELIRRLCRKRYLLTRQKQLNKNIPIMSRTINRLDNAIGEEMILSFPGAYQEMPDAYFFDPRVETWQAGPYRKNSYLLESLNYSSKSGIPLRSKSEVLIANLLEEHSLPYRYDAEMKLGGKRIYPDFIIKNPFNGKTIIWEHFGALNESGYEQKMNDEMRLYLKYGFIPFETIIYTFEFDIMDPQRLEDLVVNIIKLN